MQTSSFSISIVHGQEHAPRLRRTTERSAALPISAIKSRRQLMVKSLVRPSKNGPASASERVRVDGFYLSDMPTPCGHKLADFRRLLFPLWRHLGRVGLAWNATGPKLLSCQVILGCPVFFADFRGHHLSSRSE